VQESSLPPIESREGASCGARVDADAVVLGDLSFAFQPWAYAPPVRDAKKKLSHPDIGWLGLRRRRLAAGLASVQLSGLREKKK